MGWLAGWAKRVKLTVDAGDIDADLADFPILLYLSTSSGYNAEDISFIFDELTNDANRKKIAVTTSDETTECKVEIETWDDANEHAWLWVKAPSITDVGNTDLYLYYDHTHADNDANVGDPESAPAMAVWDANFKAVYHMRDYDTSHIHDSTSNNNDVIKKGANQPIVTTSGKIDDAQDFDGTDDYATIPFGLSPDYTIEFWAKPDVITGSRVILSFENTGAGGSGVVMGFYGTTNEILIGNDAFQKGLDGISTYLTAGTWNHWCDVVDAANDIDFYLDGALKSLDVTTYLSNAASCRDIGDRQAGAGTHSFFFDGKVDEVRISNTLRSASWIKATCETGRDHLLDWGTEETATPPSGQQLFTLINQEDY